ncbi:MAG: hypothetical protein CMM07_25740 [Rhodopirellula sp.]|nr:hypothetical protein [Rhodopirellula sp.]
MAKPTTRQTAAAKKAKAAADAQAARLDQGKPAVADTKTTKKAPAKKPVAKKTPPKKAAAKKPTKANATPKKTKQAVKATKTDADVSPDLMRRLDDYFSELKDLKLEVNETNGRLRSRIKAILQTEDWHKGAFADLRKIDNMSQTGRADYLRTFVPGFMAFFKLAWEAEMGDLLSEAEAAAQGGSEAPMPEEEPSNVVPLGKTVKDEAEAPLEAPMPEDEETKAFNEGVDQTLYAEKPAK